MCFRPATASGGDVQKNKCPECGKINKPIATTCIQCGHELTPPEQAGAPNLKARHDERMAARAPQPPNAPMPPKAPQAPGAPQASSADATEK